MSEEMTIRILAEKIAKDFQLSISERVSELLRLDATQYTNLGIDSKKYEIDKVKSDSKFIYKQVKGISEHDGNLLLNHLDS
jgi:hypothetical protein